MGKARLIFAAGLVFTLGVLGLYSLGYFENKKQIQDAVQIKLGPMEQDVGLRGQSTVRSTGDTLAVRLSIRNTRPGKRYNAHLHEGECSKGAGGGVQLASVVGTGEDTATSRSNVSMERLNFDRPHLIMVHKPDGHHALCGDLPSLYKFNR
ncbi:MAG: hypothetical protein ABEK50_16685 [bacterium]